MAFKSLKKHIGNLATPFLTNIASSLVNSGSQKDAGKVAAQLLKKGPFDIPNNPQQKVRANPLSFSPVQYPLDLGSNELGHYILFESGFLGYKPTDKSMFAKSVSLVSGGPAGQYTQRKKITAKTPSHSITTSGIAIYMPPGIKVNYSQSYEQDTGGMAADLEAGFDAFQNAQGAADKVEAALQGVIGPAVRKGKEALGEFVSLAGAGDPIRFAAKRAGVAVNPRNEMFYNTPEMRSFSFTFDFWPRNPEEAEAAEKIIAIFKYNSAPGFAAKTLGSVFTIPNYFKISYMYNNGENPHLNKIGACYCTGVDVDYAPDGQFTAFGPDEKTGSKGGRPVHTKLTVNFVEDRIITKSDIEEGA